MKLFSKTVIISTLLFLTACGGTDTKEVEVIKEVEKEVIVEVEKPVIEFVQIESECIVESNCYIIELTIPEQGIKHLSFGFSRIPEQVSLIVNSVEYTLNDWGEIDISLSSNDNVILSIQQSNSEELYVWLDNYTSNNTIYYADKNTWNVKFSYQEPELHFSIQPIAKNISQYVNSVTFKLSGDQNIENIYRAEVFTQDNCLIGSNEVGKFGTGRVEIFFINQCHDNPYYLPDEVRNYYVRFLSVTGEITWNVIDQGVSFENIQYYDEYSRMSMETPNRSTTQRNFRQLELNSPYFTQDSWSDTPAFIFDNIEIEVPEDGEYYIELTSTDCPDFECSPYKEVPLKSQLGIISIDSLWVRFNSEVILTVYDSDLSRVVVDITDCNITDSNWEVSFICPFRTK